MMADSVDDILRPITEDLRDRLFPALRDGPDVWEQMLGSRPHRSKVARAINPGVRGVRLRVVNDGGCRYTTRRWLAELWVAIAEAKAPAEQTLFSPPTLRRRRAVRPAPDDRDTQAILARHGLA